MDSRWCQAIMNRPFKATRDCYSANMWSLWGPSARQSQPCSVQLKIAPFNTDEMRFEKKKKSENLNSPEIKLRACCSQECLSPQRRGQEKKSHSNAEVPLPVLLRGNAAPQRVIFITNEINNAAICPEFSPGVLHQPREMRILRFNNKNNAGRKMYSERGPRMSKWDECHTGKCFKIPSHVLVETAWYINKIDPEIMLQTIKGESLEKKNRRRDNEWTVETSKQALNWLGSRMKRPQMQLEELQKWQQLQLIWV